jgi:hypothetical protein
MTTITYEDWKRTALPAILRATFRLEAERECDEDVRAPLGLTSSEGADEDSLQCEYGDTVFDATVGLSDEDCRRLWDEAPAPAREYAEQSVWRQEGAEGEDPRHLLALSLTYYGDDPCDGFMLDANILALVVLALREYVREENGDVERGACALLDNCNDDWPNNWEVQPVLHTLLDGSVAWLRPYVDTAELIERAEAAASA